MSEEQLNIESIEPASQDNTEAYSKCGCLKGVLSEGRVNIYKVNARCNHDVGDFSITRGAIPDVLAILSALK